MCQRIHYFGSAFVLRAHLAENPLLAQPWTLVWRTLHHEHGWRVVLSDSAYRGLTSTTPAEGLVVDSIFLSDAADPDSEEKEGERDDFVHHWRLQHGVLEAADVAQRQACRIVEGVHRFSSWRGLQHYIHRFDLPSCCFA